jgi:hypothetical protein
MLRNRERQPKASVIALAARQSSWQNSRLLYPLALVCLTFLMTMLYSLLHF